MTSSPASGPGVPGLPGFFVCIPSPFFVEEDSAQESFPHNVRHFVALLDYPGHLSIVHNNHVRDTAAGAWRKR